MTKTKRVADQFKNDMDSNGKIDFLDALSDDEIYEIVSIAAISMGHSDTLIKKAFFSYAFFNKDRMVLKKTIDSLLEMVEFKDSLSVTRKRMVKFFLQNGIVSSTSKARNDFLATYGYKSRTMAIKKHSTMDKLSFVSFYQGFIKTIISSIRNSKIQRFPYIGGSRDD